MEAELNEAKVSQRVVEHALDSGGRIIKTTTKEKRADPDRTPRARKIAG